MARPSEPKAPTHDSAAAWSFRTFRPGTQVFRTSVAEICTVGQSSSGAQGVLHILQRVFRGRARRNHRTHGVRRTWLTPRESSSRAERVYGGEVFGMLRARTFRLFAKSSCSAPEVVDSRCGQCVPRHRAAVLDDAPRGPAPRSSVRVPHQGQAAHQAHLQIWKGRGQRTWILGLTPIAAPFLTTPT